MSDVIYLSYEQVIGLNQRHCGAGAGVVNEDGIRAQLGRAEASFMGADLHPTVWEKAAVILHGLSSTQYFSDGNKRTAWLATTLFLAVNGHRLRPLTDVEAEAFVLAIATKAFENSDEPTRGVEKAAEWLDECRRRPGQRRVDALVAMDASWNRNEIGLSDGTVDITRAFVAGLGALLPLADTLINLVGVVQLHGFADDAGQAVKVRWDAHPDDKAVARLIHPTEKTGEALEAGAEVDLDDEAQFPPYQEGDVTIAPAHDMPWLANGVHPVVWKADLVLHARGPGMVRVRLSLDGEVVRVFPVRLESVSE